mgnify:FL=1
MPPRASIRVRVLVMQKRADYSYFFKHGQIQFVRVIFSMLQARRDEKLDGIGNLMQLYKFNGRDVMALDNNVYFCS